MTPNEMINDIEEIAALGERARYLGRMSTISKRIDAHVVDLKTFREQMGV